MQIISLTSLGQELGQGPVCDLIFTGVRQLRDHDRTQTIVATRDAELYIVCTDTYLSGLHDKTALVRLHDRRGHQLGLARIDQYDL